MKFVKYFRQLLEKVDLMGTKPNNYTKKLKNQAKKVESEHSDSVKKQVKTGMEHAAEFPKITKDKKIDSDYYDELDKMEGKLKKSSNKSFKDIVDEVVKENTMSGGSDSMFGANAGDGSTWNNGQSGDTYATGDARNLFGAIQGGKSKKKRKKAKVIMPMLRRTFPKS
jgi:hypothetical protein